MMRWLTLCIGVTIAAHAQVELSDSPRTGAVVLAPLFTTDYQALWTNPANLGFVPETITFSLGSPMEYGEYLVQRHWSIGAGEVGASVASNALSDAQLRSIIFQTSSAQLSLDDKRQLAEQFAGRGLSFNVDALLVGVAYQSSHWGGIGLSVRDRISAELRLNSMLSRIAFLGRLDSYFDSTAINWQGDTVGYARQPKRYSELFDSSRIAMSWLRDYAIGYGVRLHNGQRFQLYSGVTLRLIEGYILLDGRVENRSIVAYSAISPYFNVSYGKATTPSLRAGSGLIPVGSGFGADVGFTVEVDHTWRAAIAVLDIGSVFWDGNVFTVLDTVLNGMITPGFSSFNIFAEAQNITGEGGYFKWSGLKGVRRLLPTRLRLALSRSIGIERDLGIEATIPLEPRAPGAPPFSITVGTRYWVSPLFVLSAGIRVGTLAGWMLPLSLQVSLWDGRWELGVSTQDVASLVVSKRPVLSAALAVTRFHF